MGTIYNIQRFSLHDGPGIRTTVFLKGCPLRCAWCHNPESQQRRPQLSLFATRCMRCGACGAVCSCHTYANGQHAVDYAACTACGRCADACRAGALEVLGREASVAEVLEEVLRDQPFYETSGGGMTISGGEPLLQADFTAALLAAAKAEGIHTAVETCGHAPWDFFRLLLPHLDLVLFDVKQMDSALHQAFTGVGNETILENLRRLCAADIAAEVVVRVPVIPGYNDQPAHYEALAALLQTLPRIPRVELLPYNEMAGSKYPRLGMTYVPGDIREEDGQAPDQLCRLLTERGLQAQVLR